MKEEGRSPTTKSYMWLFRSGEDEEEPIILYHYAPTRKNTVSGDVNSCTVFEEIRAEGRTEGRLEGQLEGRAVEIIQMGKEFNLSDDDILARLQRRLEISLEEAKGYLEKFSK